MEDKTPTQALQLGFELALKERDEALRENARLQDDRSHAIRQAQSMKKERDQLMVSLDSLVGRSPKLSNRSVFNANAHC